MRAMTAASTEAREIPSFPWGQTVSEIVGKPREEIVLGEPITVGKFVYIPNKIREGKEQLYSMIRFELKTDSFSVLVFDGSERLVLAKHQSKNDKGGWGDISFFSSRKGPRYLNVMRGSVEMMSKFFPDENLRGSWTLDSIVSMIDQDGDGDVDIIYTRPNYGKKGRIYSSVPEDGEIMLSKPKSLLGVQLRQP